MKKKLLILVFLSTPIFGMDYLNQVKRWITQNLSGAPAVPGEQVTPLPTLPPDIQVNEIVKQLLNVSSTRDQALTLLSNYARVNKTIAEYVKNNKDTIKKILDQKFGLSLTALASGNYDDPQIKAEALRVLQNTILEFRGKEFEDTINEIVPLLQTAIENSEQQITRLDSFQTLLLISIKEQKYNLAAVILGVLDNFFSTNRLTYSNINKYYFINIIKGTISLFGTNKLVTEILILTINKAIKIFGPQFINKKTGNETLLEYVRKSKNKDAIKYFETINKLNI